MAQQVTKKVQILPELSELGVKIRHQYSLVEDGKQNDKALVKNIRMYCEMALAGLKEESIMSDPLGIVDGKGLKKDSLMFSLVESQMQELMNQDESGFVASVWVYGNAETGNGMDMVGWAKNGMLMTYEAASNTIIVVRNNVMKVFNYVVGKVTEFLAWIKVIFSVTKDYVAQKLVVGTQEEEYGGIVFEPAANSA